MPPSYEELKTELHYQKQLLDAMFNIAKNVCYIIIDAKDPEYKIINYTPNGELVFGYKTEDVIGKPVSMIQRPEVNNRMHHHISEMIAGRKNFVKETRYIKKNGEEFYGIFSSRPLYDEQGDVFAILGICVDINNSKQIEHQLRQAQKLESIGTLAGGIAHDFNNILSVIMGSAELAQSKITNDDHLKKNIQQIITASNRAKTLVNQILTFSRQTKEETKILVIKPIIKEVIKFIDSTLPATITIEQSIDLDNDVLFAEPADIHQILMNLCTNAAQSMSGTYGTLTIRARKKSAAECSNGNEQPPGDYVCISVSDTGCGINREFQSRIFDPYFTTKEKGEGTGLGLSVVHGIVNKLGGQITFISEPGEGTTFTVYLPLYTHKTIAKHKPGKKKLTYGKGERILFVDDEKAIVDIAKQTLQKLGYLVETRTSPVEALEKVKAGPAEFFDLVITDYAMPNLSGLDFAQELSAINPDLPVILCTGFVQDFDKNILLKFGIREVIKKPILQHDVAEVIHRVLCEK